MQYQVTLKDGYYQVKVVNKQGLVVNVVTASTKIEALRRAR